MKHRFTAATICSVFLALTFVSCGGTDDTDTSLSDAISDVATADIGPDLPFPDTGEPDRPGGDDLIDPVDVIDAVDIAAPIDTLDDVLSDTAVDVSPTDAADDTTDDVATDTGEPVYTGLCVLTVRNDPECDGTPATCHIVEYDAAGNPRMRKIDPGCDGQPPFEGCTWFEHDENGNRLSSGDSDSCAETPDASCTTWTYDEFGRPVTGTLDEECTGSPNECYTNTYDPSGNLRTVETAFGCTNDNRTCLRRTFDAKGALLTSGIDEGCDEATGNDNNCSVFEYLASGKPSSVESDPYCENAPTLCYRYDYFSIAGRGTVIVLEQNDCNGGNRICRAGTYKGGYNLLTETEVDQGCDGTPSADCKKFAHDANGNVTMETVDSNCDGTPEYCTYKRWSGSGTLVLESRIPGCNQPAVDCWTYSYEGNCGATVEPEFTADAEITCGASVGGNTALSSHAALSSYSCIGWTPTAKEQIFKYVAPTEGCDYKWEVTATISSLSADLDLLLLPEPNSQTCTHKSTAAGTADETMTWQAIPGADFYVVVEGYGTATGTYNLDITCECLTEPLPTCQDSCGGRSPDGTCGCDAACKWLDDCCVDRCEKCPEICAAADCGEIDSKGFCDGNTAKRCSDGVLVTEPCGDQQCKIVGYGASFPLSPCAGLPAGLCDDTEVAYFAYRADCVDP